MANWIETLAGVRPGEWRRTLLATLFYFFFVAHVVMVKSASNALFLSRHDPKDLPFLYIMVAVLVAVIVLFASNTLADPRRRRLRQASLAFTGLVLLACWALLRFRLLPVSPALYLFGEISATALNLQFWSVAGDIFDPREGKRVFGVLAGGGMSGSIFGGLLVHQAGLLIGTVNLLPAAVASLAVCSICAHSLSKHHGRADALPSGLGPSLRTGLRYAASDPFPRTFAALMLLGMVLTAFVDYFFRLSARSFLGEDQLAALFGDLNVYVGLISVAFLFLVAHRILRRIGIFYYLLIVPGCLMVAAGVSIAFPAFLFVYALKIIENSGSLSINQAGLQLLYNPMPAILRTPARGVIDGLSRKLGYAVGGLMLLVLAPLLHPPAWQLIILVLVLGFGALLLRLRVLYVRAFDERLRVGAQGPADLMLEDANTHRALLRALDPENPELCRLALRLLTEIPTVDLAGPLERLIEHADEGVRVAAIEAVAARGYKAFSFHLLGIINNDSRRCRVAAVRALVTLDPSRASGALAPYLRSEDPGLVTASIEALLQLRGQGNDNPAVATLEQLLEAGSDTTAPQRRETAKLLGRLGEGSRYAPHLLTYLNDPDGSVRRLAAQSCRAVFREEFVPRLMRMLSDRETRQDAREALAAYGDRVMNTLEEWLNDRDRPLQVRLRLPRLVRLIGTQQAGEALLFSNIQDDAFLRYRIALALSGIRQQHREVRFDRKWTLEAVDRRLDAYRYYAGVVEQLAQHLPQRTLVMRVLRDRLEQNMEIAFRVLGLIYPHRTLMSIFHRLQSASFETWADAVELLDNVIDRESRERLLPLLETHRSLLRRDTGAPGSLDLSPAAQALAALSESKDLLLQAAAIHTRCALGDDCAARYPELFQGEATVDIMEKVLFLESVDIFRRNNLDDLTALAAIAHEKAFRAGERILVEGEPGDALYIITRGQADIVKGSRRLLRLGEKNSLGGVSLLDQKPHAASAVCAMDCSALVIDRTDFMDLVSDRVELLHGVFLALTDRLRALLAVTEGGGLAESEEYDDGPTNPV